MPGINEILILAVIVVGFLLLPRMTGRGEEVIPVSATPVVEISGTMRLAIAASLLWPAAAAVYLEPWKGNLITFLLIGPGPVVLAWTLSWVIAGFREGRR